MNARLRRMGFAVVRAWKAFLAFWAAALTTNAAGRRGKYPRRPCPLCGRSVAWTKANSPWARHRCQRRLPFSDLTQVGKE